MDANGDIPDKSEIEPNGSTMLELFTEVLEHGEAHVYLENLPEGEDIHCKQFNTHVFEDFGHFNQGLIYTQVNEEDKWIDPDAITMVERHYE